MKNPRALGGPRCRDVLSRQEDHPPGLLPKGTKIYGSVLGLVACSFGSLVRKEHLSIKSQLTKRVAEEFCERPFHTILNATQPLVLTVP